MTPTPARTRLLLALVLLAAGCSSAGPPRVPAAPPAPDPGAAEIARQTAGLERRSGLLDLYLDRSRGRLLALLPAPAGARGEIGEFLLLEGVVTGLGANALGLDRGRPGATRVVALRRVGSRVLLEATNWSFRAVGADAPATAAVRDSFATSVLWGTEVLAAGPDGRLLVDLSGLALRDAHEVSARLAGAGEGAFALDRERSALDLERCRAFPANIELEAVLTFAGSGAGAELRAVAPDPRAVTLVQRQSLVSLPPPGFRPRPHDPRMGSFAIAFADFAAPLDAELERRWIARHRLQRSDPAAPGAGPLVYYVDRAAPEPVRAALVEGASWWADAFAAAGFPDAFRVELLPEDGDPLDVRYNVIEWVPRATRGWSYGSTVIDPRTGEIVRGHVAIDALRIRQDRLLLEGLVGAAGGGAGEGEPLAVALARIRQLAAHEVGHTLGLAHNFAGSAFDRASVMDYPAPLVGFDEAGELDLSRAYATGIGAWDRAAIRWAYSEVAPGTDERSQLDAWVAATLATGLVFLSDEDARPAGAAQPLASLWDNGADPVAALRRTMRVRQAALARFGERNLAPGVPLARLEEVFATVYFHHRYQLTAAAKTLGGLDYRPGLAGDGQRRAQPLPPGRQRRALAAVLEALAPAALDVPEPVLALLLPRPAGFARSREQLASRTAPAFDALGAAATAADLVLAELLEPARAARLVDFHRRNRDLPDFAEVLETLIGQVFADPATLSPRLAELAHVAQRVTVERLLGLSADAAAAPWVRSRVDAALSDLLQRLDKIAPLDASERAHLSALAAEIGRHLARPAPARESQPGAPPPPPGDPIGAAPALFADCGFEPPRP